MRWLDWAHVISSFRGQWLPGDPRGFHDHGRRAVSHGHTTAPPHPSEHAGLRVRARAITGQPVTPTPPEREQIGRLLLEKFELMDVAVAALAVSSTHCHALIRVFDADARPIFGRAKQHASVHLRDALPGKLWGASCGVFRMASEKQFERVRAYIVEHRDEQAWVFVAL